MSVCVSVIQTFLPVQFRGAAKRMSVTPCAQRWEVPCKVSQGVSQFWEARCHTLQGVSQLWEVPC